MTEVSAGRRDGAADIIVPHPSVGYAMRAALTSRRPNGRFRYIACKGLLQILQMLQLFQMEASVTGALTKLQVEESDREQARKGASLLERASLLEHGGLFLTRTDGERVMAEMPASLLRAMQSLLTALAEAGVAFVFRPEDEVSPERAAELLGVSRPIVYQRLDSGKLPFRQVGTHRRIRATDVAELKQFEDRRRAFAVALSADTEDLEENYAKPGKSAS
jgi:excisionase family DNA binding protein